MFFQVPSITGDPYEFSLPETAPDPVKAFMELWMERADASLPRASDFDLAQLADDFPHLARIGDPEGAGTDLFWRDCVTVKAWPFAQPVVGRPLSESLPAHSVARVHAAFREVITTAMPSYSEITTWLNDGGELALGRLTIPVVGEAGDIELLALWVVLGDEQTA